MREIVFNSLVAPATFERKEDQAFPSVETALKVFRPHFATFRGFLRRARDCSSMEQTRAPAPGIELPPQRCRGARKSNSEHLMRATGSSLGSSASGPPFYTTASRGRLRRIVWPRMRTEVQITGHDDKDLSHDVSARRGTRSVAERIEEPSKVRCRTCACSRRCTRVSSMIDSVFGNKKVLEKSFLKLRSSSFLDQTDKYFLIESHY